MHSISSSDPLVSFGSAPLAPIPDPSRVAFETHDSPLVGAVATGKLGGVVNARAYIRPGRRHGSRHTARRLRRFMIWRTVRASGRVIGIRAIPDADVSRRFDSDSTNVLSSGERLHFRSCSTLSAIRLLRRYVPCAQLVSRRRACRAPNQPPPADG